MSKVRIIAMLNPVTRERVACEIPAKGRLSDHIAVPEGNIVYRNGEPYENGELFPNDLINIIVPPQGGEQGKDLARTGIILSAQILAGIATGGLSTIPSALITGAVYVGSPILANALIPPPTPSLGGNGAQEEFQRLGAITGSRNQINPYGVVPRVYGHRKIYPPMSAKPFTEIVGNRQYMRILFNVGAGPLELSNPKIGDTVIGSFNSSNIFTSNDTYQGIQVEVAENPSLYSSTVDESAPGVVFEEADDTAIRTTAIDTEEISIDLTFPQGLFGVDGNGRTIGVWMHWKVEYSPTGQGSWTEVTESNIRDTVSFIPRPGAADGWRSLGSKRETWRGGLSWQVPSGQYDVRITRIDKAFTSVDGSEVFDPFDEDVQVINTFDSATWTALRSITHEEPTDLPGTVQIAMRIQATDQISGVLDNFSVEAKSRLAFYDGTAWDVPTFDSSTGNGTGGKITSNPAWILADVLTGSQNARPVSRDDLDADDFKDFADNCTAEGRECNTVLDQSRTLQQTLSIIGSTGRGSHAIPDGTHTIIQDLDGLTPAQHFTPRNSWDFSSMRTFPKVPHAIRVNFIDPDAGWEVNEAVVYDDGYSLDGTNCLFDDGTGVCKVATNFETLDLSDTVTSYDQAWKEGRFRMAEARLRPERYTNMADVESIICQRGDLILDSHDITLWGGQWGRIKSIDGNVLTLDEEVIIEEGESYNIRVRNKSGSSIVKTVSTGAGTHNDITVNNVTDIDEGDLFMFGEVGVETQSLKVFSIEPQGDLSARMTFVDAAPEIYNADQQAIPDFDSNITSPAVDPSTTPPPEPIITNVRSDGDSLYEDADGNPSLRIVVSFVVGGGTPTEFIEGRFRREDDTDGWTGFGQVPASTGSISLPNADRGGVYVFQLRARRGELTSDWVQSASHTAGQNIKLKGRPENAIGYITEDLDGTYTEIPVFLNNTARDGIDYNIVAELDRVLIPITPTVTAPSGSDTIEIDSTYIEAPSGSYIVKAPGQEEAETIEKEERIRVLDEVKIPELESLIENIQVDIIDDAINTAIDEAVAGLDFYDKETIDALSVTLSDAIDGRVGLDTTYQQVEISDANGLLVTGVDGANAVGRINLRGSGTTSEGQSFAGIHIQKLVGGEWDTNFFADLDGNLYMTGTLQPGSVLVGDPDNASVIIDETLGVLVQDVNARVLLNASGVDDEATSFAGISIQKWVDPDWVSNFHASADGDIFARGNFELLEGSILVGTTSEGVFIDSVLGLLVQGANARVILNATDPTTEDVSFAGINIQKWVDPDWVSNFYATPAGDVFLRGEINANSGSIGNLILNSDGITNAAADFRVFEDGFETVQTAGTNVPERTYAVVDGSAVVRGGFWGSSSNIFLESHERGLQMISWTGGTFASPSQAEGQVHLRTNGNAEMWGRDNLKLYSINGSVDFEASTRVTTNARFRPVNLTETERDNLTGNSAGDIIYNTTTARHNYYDGTNWVNF